MGGLNRGLHLLDIESDLLEYRLRLHGKSDELLEDLRLFSSSLSPFSHLSIDGVETRFGRSPDIIVRLKG